MIYRSLATIVFAFAIFSAEAQTKKPTEVDEDSEIVRKSAKRIASLSDTASKEEIERVLRDVTKGNLYIYMPTLSYQLMTKTLRRLGKADVANRVEKDLTAHWKEEGGRPMTFMGYDTYVAGIEVMKGVAELQDQVKKLESEAKVLRIEAKQASEEKADLQKRLSACENRPTSSAIESNKARKDTLIGGGQPSSHYGNAFGGGYSGDTH